MEEEDADPFEALSIGISQPEVLQYYQSNKLSLDELIALYRRGPLEASGVVLLPDGTNTKFQTNDSLRTLLYRPLATSQKTSQTIADSCFRKLVTPQG